MNIDKNLACQLIDDLLKVTSSDDYKLDKNSKDSNLTRANKIEKRLRACFFKFLATLVCDYRQSLCAVRFKPKPMIFFDKAHFFGRKRQKYQPHTSSFLGNFVDIFLEQLLQVDTGVQASIGPKR